VSLWFAFSFAVPCSAQLPTKFITEYRLDRTVVEIPFSYVRNQIIVTGKADDKQELTFLFDTGATLPVIDTALGLRGTHIADTQFREAEGLTKAESVWISEIQLSGDKGRATVNNVAVLLVDLGNISRMMGQKIDAIIGAGWMAGYITEIDYQKKVLRFRSPRSNFLEGREPDNQRSFLYDLKPINSKASISCLMVTGKIDSGYDYDFLLDTGFGGYASVAHSAARESGMYTNETPRIESFASGVTRKFRSNKIRAPFFMLGKINLSGRVVQIDVRNNDEYGQTGIIGNRFLQNYRVTLDYQRKKLLLERVTEREELDDTERRVLGITVRLDGRVVSVDKVVRNSPAALAGVRPGDVILAINRQKVEMIGMNRAVTMIGQPDGETVLEMKRGADPNFGTGGSPMSVTIVPLSPLDWK